MRQGRNAKQLSKCGYFHPFSLKHCFCLYISVKVKAAVEIYKSGSSSKFALSYHTTFRQSKCRMTDLLNIFPCTPETISLNFYLLQRGDRHHTNS
jgi:hypothetical protein